jgi:hypothetical protein
LLLPLSSFAQRQLPVSDGPYVFYRSGMVYVKSIVLVDSMPRAVIDSFPEKNKELHILSVKIDSHPDWDFTVKLKKRIKIPSSIYSGQEEKTLILSDVEGEFEPFRNLLLAGKVIDEKYNWTFGNGNLIVAGDLFDRGRQVCQFLWLLYKLEEEAAENGGSVHVILGNHEIMNLSGDFRYVQQSYLVNAHRISEAYANYYAADTELGRWLRSKNIIEKVGNMLVMHGGISRQVLAKNLDPETINASCRPYYDATSKPIPDNLTDFFDESSPFWYRGYFVEPKATLGLVDSTLAFYRVKRIIVGHDIIEHVAPLYDGKIIGVDVDEHKGTHEALLIETGRYYRMDDKGSKTLILN